LRILTDETVANSTIALLRHLGHDVADVREVGLGGSADEDIAALAKSERRVVITHDKGFGDLLRFEPGSHCGAIVLRLRLPTPDATNAVLSTFVCSVPDDYAFGRLIILSERGFRSRKL